MVSEAQKRASMKYRKENEKSVMFWLNKRTESDIIDHLEKQANKAGYIKELIKRDMQ